MTVAELTSFGWHVNDGLLKIDWDSYEHNEAVKEWVVQLMKGCMCKTVARLVDVAAEKGPDLFWGVFMC